MKMIMAILLLLTSFTVSACIKSNPARTTVSTPAGDVTYHCPPGQRKKGKC
jgi:hypothetical protein